jgi:hypothetical protein
MLHILLGRARAVGGGAEYAEDAAGGRASEGLSGADVKHINKELSAIGLLDAAG